MSSKMARGQSNQMFSLSLSIHLPGLPPLVGALLTSTVVSLTLRKCVLLPSARAPGQMGYIAAWPALIPIPPQSTTN